MDDYRVDGAGHGYRRRFRFLTTNLRRNYRSYYAASVATNKPTHGLYNASTGALVVVLRGYGFSGYAATPIVGLSAVQGIVGTDSGAEYPLWPGDAQPAAVHTYIDTATVYAPQVVISVATAGVVLAVSGSPLMIAPPGWSILAQPSVNAGTVLFNWFWEELNIDDPELGNILG